MSSPPPLLLFRRTPTGLNRTVLRAFARRLRDQVAAGRNFCCLISDDRELHRLNVQFLKKDYATDVLSFPESGQTGVAADFLGELAISRQRASEQARQQGHSLEKEIQILMLHGVLHLIGMDHERDDGSMARAERDWRRRLGLPAGLIERSAS
jgi:probable rRNA maturation factor